MFILVLWVQEGTYSIIKYSCVVKPRREFDEYRLGEEVEAKFQGKTYPAEIITKGVDKKELEKEMDTLIERVNSNILAVSGKEKHMKKKGMEKNSAQLEKQKKAAETLKEKQTQREVLKKKKERLIAVLDSELAISRKSPRKTPVSSSSSFRSPRKMLANLTPVSPSSPRRSPRKSLASSKTILSSSPRSPRKTLALIKTISSSSRSPRRTLASLEPLSPSSPRRSPRKTLASSKTITSSSPRRSPRKTLVSIKTISSSSRSPRRTLASLEPLSPSSPRSSPRKTLALLKPVSPSSSCLRKTLSSLEPLSHSSPRRSPRKTLASLKPVSSSRSPRTTLASLKPVSPLSRSPRRTLESLKSVSPSRKLLANLTPVSLSSGSPRRKMLANLTPVSPSLFSESDQLMSPSPDSSPASTVSHSLFDDVPTGGNKRSTQPRSLYFSEDPPVPVNAKGHPTVAAKQPRNRCETCEVLRQENRELRKQIDDLSHKASLSSENEKLATQYARPPAGVYDEDFASQNGMMELFSATGVYVHKDQMHTALNKTAVTCTSATPKGGSKSMSSPKEGSMSTTSPKEGSTKTGGDGKRVARYLLTVFFTKEQLQHSSLTASEASQYRPLNQQIIEAIIAFSVFNSDTRRGDILKAMRASLTSKRCKAKKKAAVTV